MLTTSFVSAEMRAIEDEELSEYVGQAAVAFDVDQIGDVPLTLTIIKNETGYSSQLDMRGDAAESGDYTWEVEETKIEDEIITIEAIIASYDVNFELSIEGDEISGAMMGMFDVEGSRVQPQ